MVQFAARFKDDGGKFADMHFHAQSAADAVLVASDLAAKSDASWTALFEITDLTVDSGTYTEFNNGAKPAAGSTVRAQGELHYGVQTPQQELILSIPAVKSNVLSPLIKKTGTDPIAAVGVLLDEEGVATTSFNKGLYRWKRRKGA